MDKLKHIIGKSALLSTIPQDEVAHYLSEGRFHAASHEKGRVVHFDGEICDRIEVILSGTVTVDRIDQPGNLLAIAELGSGDILGGNLVFSKNPRYPMTVTAQTTAILLGIKKDLVLDLCFGNRDFLENFLMVISDQAFNLGDKIRHYIKRTIRESVMNFLKHEQVLQKSNRIRLNMTKKALAEKIGVQRTSLSRELQKMRNEGVLLLESGFITILKDDCGEFR